MDYVELQWFMIINLQCFQGFAAFLQCFRILMIFEFVNDFLTGNDL